MEALDRETVITWNDADGSVATVYTAQRPMTTRLAKIRGAEKVEVHRTERGDWTGETWEVPLASVLPRNVGKRQLSEEQRKVLGERLRRVREGQKATPVAAG